jgi:hypothetical protein
LQRTRGKRRSAERELSKLIADDLAANPDFSNSHRIDIGASLAAPTRLTCEDSLRDNASLDLSLVLEECPGGKHGTWSYSTRSAASFASPFQAREIQCS